MVRRCLLTRATSLTPMPLPFWRLVVFVLWPFVAATWQPTLGLTSLTCACIASVLKLSIANWRRWGCNIFMLELITVLTLNPGLACSPSPLPISCLTSNQGIFTKQRMDQNPSVLADMPGDLCRRWRELPAILEWGV